MTTINIFVQNFILILNIEYDEQNKTFLFIFFFFIIPLFEHRLTSKEFRGQYFINTMNGETRERIDGEPAVKIPKISKMSTIISVSFQLDWLNCAFLSIC